MADFLAQIPELQEAYTRADLELALEDRGWLTQGRHGNAAELDTQSRTLIVAKARRYWLRDPLMKQPVRLWTDYALGTGVTWDSKDAKIKKRCDDFAEAGRNSTIMDSEGQRRSSKKLLVDGELFFAIFDPESGSKEKTIRRIDCLQITDFICDPDDEEHVLGYRRQTAADKTLYYADWRNTDYDNEMLAEQSDPSTKSKIGDKVETDCRVYHLPFDTLLKRGNSLLSPVLDWSKEHKRFMEARVAITQALAKFAWKGKVKGGQGIINQVQSKLESTSVKSGQFSVERHPQSAHGGTWLENAGMDLAPTPRGTGAGDAASDGNQLKLMTCAGTGVFLHYFGDPSTGNLATAVSMELPMLKMFQSYQSLWKDAYKNILAIALTKDPEEIREMRQKITLDLPPILLDDTRKLGQYITSVGALFPEICVPEVLQALLTPLNVENLDEVMDSIENKRGELALQDKQDKAHQIALVRARGNSDPNDPNDPNDPEANPGGDPTDPASGVPTTESARQTKALKRLARLMEEVAR